MKIADHMTTDVVCANLEDGLYQTMERMRERNVRHMPVLDDQERIVGVISERDIRRPKWVDDPNLARPYVLDNSVKVHEAMTGNPEVVAASDPVERALDVLIADRFGALPVVDGERRVVGIISTIDLLQALRDLLAKR
ncbi:MAG: CBS domain-containing protein [Myxococcales bacterium]|nr:CBS domain-containing protein [Myxococcales bacterium]